VQGEQIPGNFSLLSGFFVVFSVSFRNFGEVSGSVGWYDIDFFGFAIIVAVLKKYFELPQCLPTLHSSN
jgi:hypothetical protein